MTHHFQFDHCPDPDEVLLALKRVADEWGKPLSDPLLSVWTGNLHRDTQVLHLMIDMLALHEPRLSVWARAYANAARAEMRDPAAIRAAVEIMTAEHEAIVCQLEQAADWLEENA